MHMSKRLVSEGQMVKKGEEEIKLNSVIVYVDKNNTFYLPEELEEYIENK